MTIARAARGIGLAVALAAATLFTTWGLLFYRPLPTVDGHYRLLGLHERGEVIRDVFGIPRIYARDLHDLFFLQGYITAQDRFGQMETKRGLGRLGGSRLLEGDLERSLASAPEAVRGSLDAYAAGVNKYVEQHRAARALPGELALEGRRLEPWTPRDSIAILAGHLVRIRPSSLCLTIPGDAAIKGRPLLGADLHFDEVPPRQDERDAGLYEVGLDGGGARGIGASIPGVPGLVSGHNGWVAWALTYASRSDDAVTTFAAMLRVLEARRVREVGAPLRCAADVYGERRGDDARPLARNVDLEALRSALGRPRSSVGGRLLVDLADVDTSRSAVSRGASAHRSSPHYDDQKPLWEIGQTHRLPFTRGAIGRTDGELVLRAR